MLGGCSSHNSCIAFVPPDSRLRTLARRRRGGWGLGAVAPYYERVLSMVGLERSDSGNALVAAFLAAAAEAGHPTLDFTRQLGAGAGWFRLNKRGIARASSSAAYLHPLAERSPTLTVHTGTRARRLVLDGGRAVAVETDRGRIGVGREAVVCAGRLRHAQAADAVRAGARPRARAPRHRRHCRSARGRGEPAGPPRGGDRVGGRAGRAARDGQPLRGGSVRPRGPGHAIPGPDVALRHRGLRPSRRPRWATPRRRTPSA